jgi:hypothetical protein
MYGVRSFDGKSDGRAILRLEDNTGIFLLYGIQWWYLTENEIKQLNIEKAGTDIR